MRWPVGTTEEIKKSRGELPGSWYNANPFLNWYELRGGVFNYHDGVDLNNNKPYWNSDFHSPIFAPANGVVTFAGPGGGTWGHLVNIKHTSGVTSSFGHIENILVKVGDVVQEGQHICNVGNGDGWYAGGGEHLHFRICTTDMLQKLPRQWSGTNKKMIQENYVDPVKYLRNNYMDPVKNFDTREALQTALRGLPADSEALIVTPLYIPPQEPLMTAQVWRMRVGDLLDVTNPVPDPAETPITAYINTASLNVRKSKSEFSDIIGQLQRSTAVKVIVVPFVSGDKYEWMKITEGPFKDGYLAKQYLSFQ